MPKQRRSGRPEGSQRYMNITKRMGDQSESSDIPYYQGLILEERLDPEFRSSPPYHRYAGFIEQIDAPLTPAESQIRNYLENTPTPMNEDEDIDAEETLVPRLYYRMDINIPDKDREPLAAYWLRRSADDLVRIFSNISSISLQRNIEGSLVQSQEYLEIVREPLLHAWGMYINAQKKLGMREYIFRVPG